MSETNARKSDELSCLNCRNAKADNKFHEIFDKLGVELGLPGLVKTYLKLNVSPRYKRRQLLCEVCLGDLISAFDVDEFNKQNSNSANQSREEKQDVVPAVKIEKPRVVSTKSYTRSADDLKKLSAVRSVKKTEQTTLPQAVAVKPSTRASLLQSNTTAPKRITRKRTLLKRENENDQEIEAIFKGVIELDDEPETGDGCSSPPKKKQTVFIVSSGGSANYIDEGESIIIQGTEIPYDEIENYKAEVINENEERNISIAISECDRDTFSSADERMDACTPDDDAMDMEEEVELYSLIPLAAEDEQVDLPAYLDEAIKSDFKMLKFKWSTECHLCPWKGETFQSLLAHVCKTHRLAKDYYSCPAEDCGEQVKGKNSIARHIVLKHAPLDDLQIYGSCPDCQKTFSSFVVFNKHSCARPIKRRRGMRMYCEMCGIDFPSMKRFIFHMQFHLEKHRPRICFICDYTNYNVEELFEHIYYEHESSDTYACKICDRVFKDEQKFGEHKHADTAEYLCIECNKSFSNKSRLMAHNKQTHTEFLKCDICKKEFASREQYRQHAKWHSNSAVALHTCSNCGLVCVDRADVEKHVRSLATECHGAKVEEEVISFAYTCEFCSLDFKSKNDLKLHRSTGVHNDGQYKCLPCNKTFSLMKLYRAHKKHTQSDWKNDNICSLYMCNVDDCEETYSQWNSLYTHKRRHHSSIKSEEAEIDEEAVVNEKPKFVCQFCDKNCPTKMSLSVHVARRHNNKNVVCSHCSASFKNDAALQKHVDYMHVPIECAVCFKVVKNRRNYEVHERVVHMAEKRYFCKVCEKGFYHKSDKEAHAKLHDQIFTCEECDFATNYAKSLEIHFASLHRKEYAFECDICKKKFGRKQALQIHIKRHSQTKQYHCSKLSRNGCRKKFTTQSDLNKHLRTVHGLERLDKSKNKSQKLSDVEWDLEQEVYEIANEDLKDENNDDETQAVDDDKIYEIEEYIVEGDELDEQNYEFVLIRE